MNRTTIFGLAALVVLLFAGCVQTENTERAVNQGINNSQVVSDQNKPSIVEIRYVCPDGSNVTDASKCPEPKEQEVEVSLTNCIDGTSKLTCSISKPYFCAEDLTLVERATRCGCPISMDLLQDTCLPRSNDGTREGLCSITKPKQCINGQFIDNPGKCGCPTGYELNATARYCQVHLKTQEDIWLENSAELSRLLTLEYFSLVIKRVGYYETLDKKVYIRLDIKLTNKDNEPQDFFISNMALVDSAKYQYDSTDDGTFKGGQFYPGVRREGSVLFEVGDRKPNFVTLMVTDGYDENFEKVIRKTMLELN